MMNYWILVFCAVFGWMSCLTGVALGGFLVYRTKRDSYDPLFNIKQPKGDSFNIQDIPDITGSPESLDAMMRYNSSHANGHTLEANERFVEKFASDVATKASKQRREIKEEADV